MCTLFMLIGHFTLVLYDKACKCEWTLEWHVDYVLRIQKTL